MDEEHIHAAGAKLAGVALIATLRLTTLATVIGRARIANLHDAYGGVLCGEGERLIVYLLLSFFSATHLQYGWHCCLYTLVPYAACTSHGAACSCGIVVAIDANTATDGAAVAAATTTTSTTSTSTTNVAIGIAR